jgi:small subunit ribosomal protein S2
MDKKILNSMFENLLHIGNKSNYWNPKMKNYIYGSVNGVHVINLIKTVEKLEEVKKQLISLASEGKKILFVATKLQSRDAFSKLATETGHYYVTEKWVPGLLTNFKTIKRRINTYLKLLKDSETWAFNILTKKEIAAKMLELEKLDKAFKWLKEMKKIPDVLFVVDGIYEKQAVKEGNSLKISTFAILNTNGDDTIVTNLIPANTNSVKSIEFLAASLKEALTGIKVVKKSPVNVIKRPDQQSGDDKVSAKKEVVEEKVAKKPEVKEVKEEKETNKDAPVKKITPKKVVEKKETTKKATTPKKEEEKKTTKKETTTKK